MSLAATVGKVTEAVRKFFLPAISLVQKPQKSIDYWADIPVGHTPNDILQPDYWAHVARKLRTNSMIHVRAVDTTFFGCLLVLASSDSWARVAWLYLVETDEPMASDPTPQYDLYKIDHIGTGFRVILKATGKVLIEKLGRRSEAEAWVEQAIKDKGGN